LGDWIFIKFKVKLLSGFNIQLHEGGKCWLHLNWIELNLVLAKLIHWGALGRCFYCLRSFYFEREQVIGCVINWLRRFLVDFRCAWECRGCWPTWRRLWRRRAPSWMSAWGRSWCTAPASKKHSLSAKINGCLSVR